MIRIASQRAETLDGQKRGFVIPLFVALPVERPSFLLQISMALLLSGGRHHTGRRGIPLGSIGIAQARHRKIATSPLTIRRIEPATLRLLLCLMRGRYVLLLGSQQQCVRLVIAALVDRSLGLGGECRDSRISRIKHGQAIKHRPVPGGDFTQLQGHLFRRHVLLRYGRSQLQRPE